MSLDFSTLSKASSSPAFLPILSLVVCLLVRYWHYKYLTGPLNKIPGPFLSAFTNLWLVRETRQRRRHMSDVELHGRYGPVVRIGPREVSLSSPAAVKAVYGNMNGKTLKKGDWYKLVSPPTNGGFNLLSELDINRYRTQRRLIHPIYTESSIMDLEESLDTILVKNLVSMRQQCGIIVDLDNWSHMHALDCLTAAVFSKSTSQVTMGKDDGTFARIKKGWEYLHWASRFPFLHWSNLWCLRVTGRGLWLKKALKEPPILEWAIDQLDVIMSANAVPDPKKAPDLATKLVTLHRTNPLFTEPHLTDMTLTHLGAGLETLGITLASFLYNIIERPTLQTKIQRELNDALKREELEFSSREILKVGEMKSKLKLLEACLRESWRLNPVVGVPFPRVVGPEDMLIDRNWIPAGTTVGVNPWVAGRSAELYGHDALDFRPERWLSMSKEERIRIESYNQTFGLGHHTCPGKHLAQAILHKLIPMLLMHFSWEFEDADADRIRETMFGVRWKGVDIRWKQRSMRD